MDKVTLTRALLERRAEVYHEVWRREGGRCIVCGKAAAHVHEIEQKSHHPRSKQLEAGTFSMENCVAVCERCHRKAGQHRAGWWMFMFLLHVKHDYKMPDWYGE